MGAKSGFRTYFSNGFATLSFENLDYNTNQKPVSLRMAYTAR